MKSVVIADNHPLFRAGVRQLIEQDDRYRIVAEVGDCESCLFQVRELSPDILLLDLNMPEKGGFDVVRDLKSEDSPTEIVILSMYASREFVEIANQLGCAGFVAKEDAGSELISALGNIGNGFQMTSSVGRGESEFPGSEVGVSGADLPELDRLTRMELLVLAKVAESKTSHEIAEDMGISTRTVDTHRQNTMRKLELSGANGLVRYAVRNQEKIAAIRDGQD